MLPPKKYPHRDKLFGLDLLWKCTQSIKAHTFLQDNQSWIQETCQTFQYLVLGRKAIITIDPRNIKAILSTQFKEFGLGEPRLKGLKPLFADGIFNTEGPSWLNSKIFLRRYLARHSEDELAVFERSVQLLLEHIPKNGASVDLQYLFSLLTLDTATDIFLGTSSNALKSHSNGNPGTRFAEAFDYVQAYVSGIDDINIFAMVKNMFHKSLFKQSLTAVNSFIEELMENALSRSELPQESTEMTLLQGLIASGADRAKIKTDVLNVLLAAKDTTKTVLSNVWFLLARHPETFEQLRKEIAGLDGRRPSVFELSEMRVLNCIIKETLRLFPPVALNQRTASKDTTIPFGAGSDGLSTMFVGRGTSVGYSTYALHRRPDIYGLDAEIFRPERWFDNTLQPGWSYIPFHAGPRKCPGQRLAMAQIAYVTVRLTQNITHVTNADSRPWTESLGLNCFSRYGTVVKVKHISGD